METTIQKTLPAHIKSIVSTLGFILAFFVLPAQTVVDINCKTPWIPPFFSVGENHWDEPTSFWQNGGHIPENVIDEDTTNYARAHIKASGSATINVYDTDDTHVYPSGFFVGYVVKSRTFRDSVFDGVTVTTYLNGVMQESYSGVHLSISHYPEFVNEPVCVGFMSSLPWNEIEISFSSDGPRVHYDVFYAIIGECLEELPPGLPITWLSFEVQKKGEASDLRWTTAQEFNNTGFHVERSTDGRYFEPIGYVNASINPSGIRLYSFMDRTPIKGTNYYRIVQQDTDGKIYYSVIRSISFTDPGTIRSWPNPATSSLIVELPSDALEQGHIKLVSATGMVVLSQRYESRERQSILDVSDIEPGIYRLVIDLPDQTLVHNVLIAK